MKTGFQLVDDRHFLGCGDRIALVPWLRPGTQCPEALPPEFSFSRQEPAMQFVPGQEPWHESHP